MIPFLLFAGFFVNQINIPYYFYPFEYLSVFKYVFQAAFIVFSFEIFLLNYYYFYFYKEKLIKYF